jgi:hypothetical protein
MKAGWTDETTIWDRPTRRRLVDELWMLQDKSIMKLTVTGIAVRVATSYGKSFRVSFG